MVAKPLSCSCIGLLHTVNLVSVKYQPSWSLFDGEQMTFYVEDSL